MPAYRVPASTTNLAHGFDCLGIAVGLYNTVTVTPSGSTVTAPGSADPGLVTMAERVRGACAQTWGTPLPGFTVRVQGDVPIARGLGSSSTILLGVAAACQAMAGRPFAREELVPLCAALEGHPDNVTAACLGGFTAVGEIGGRLRWQRFDPPAGLRCVLVIPDYEVKTSEARRILPPQLDKAAHVRGLQSTALIVAALARGAVDGLAGLFADAWHESHRATLNPSLPTIRLAAERSGAVGAFLSGSGSTMLALARAESAEAVAAACRAALPSALVRNEAFAAEGVSPA